MDIGYNVRRRILRDTHTHTQEKKQYAARQNCHAGEHISFIRTIYRRGIFPIISMDIGYNVIRRILRDTHTHTQKQYAARQNCHAGEHISFIRTIYRRRIFPIISMDIGYNVIRRILRDTHTHTQEKKQYAARQNCHAGEHISFIRTIYRRGIFPIISMTTLCKKK